MQACEIFCIDTVADLRYRQLSFLGNVHRVNNKKVIVFFLVSPEQLLRSFFNMCVDFISKCLSPSVCHARF